MGAEIAAKLKDEGNVAFKSGRFLEAAALYTKALKQDPDNAHSTAVLYSNRSASLLKLNKVAKAAADAEECIARRPDWDKAHVRRGAVLEAKDMLPEALAAYEKAAQLSSGNPEVEAKVKDLRRRLHKQSSSSSSSKPSKPQDASAAAGDEKELLGFSGDIMDILRTQIKERGAAGVPPCVYLWPVTVTSGAGEQLTQISIAQAFDSPDTLQECVAEVRELAAQRSSTAACAVVPKSCIAYPQVWKRPGWHAGSEDGFFVQLDSLRVKHTWFLPLKKGVLGDPAALSQDFKLLEALFR